jgi:hypothetical protein
MRWLLNITLKLPATDTFNDCCPLVGLSQRDPTPSMIAHFSPSLTPVDIRSMAPGTQMQPLMLITLVRPSNHLAHAAYIHPAC